jgi:hypothetical protein
MLRILGLHMASTLNPHTVSQPETSYDENAVAVIDAEEFEAARRDPRVLAFWKKADAYLASLERDGRNL